jgi:hypothetical protein
VLSESDLVTCFRSRGQMQGGELYLSLAATLDFISACQENEIAVVGIEGFTDAGRKKTPLLDCIADYSTIAADTWLDFCRLCNEASRKFLSMQTSDKNMVFTLVPLTKDEWSI